MKVAELQRLPEEVPRSLDPVPLQDLVQTVREVVEPVEADRRRDCGDEAEEGEIFLADGRILSDK